MDEKTQEETQGETAQGSEAQTTPSGTNDNQNRYATKDATEAATTELDRADQIAERQKRENDRREAILLREEALAARKAVGGVTEAGQPSQPKEETPLEYKNRIEKEGL